VAKARDKRLGSKFAGLTGRRLLDALGQAGETATLEAFWQYQSVQVTAEVVGPMVASRDKHLLRLVIDEVVSPKLDQTTARSIVSAIDEHRPALTPADGKRLAEYLQTEDSLNQFYEPYRASLLAWLAAQPGALGEKAALDVIARRVTGSDQGQAREAAYARCAGSATLLRKAAETMLEELDAGLNQQVWQHAAEFVDQACRDATTTPGPMRPIIERLVDTAPSHFQNQRFSPTLHRFAAESATGVIESKAGQRLADNAGARALLALLPDVPTASERAKLWATAAEVQEALWPVLQQQTSEWDEAEWRRVLRALARRNPVQRQALNYLVSAAPIELTAELMQLVMTHVSSDDALISTVGQRLRERLEALGHGTETRDQWVAAAHWPKQREAESLAKFDAIVGCVDGSLHARLLVRGYLAGKLTAKVAAELMPVGQVGPALEMVAAGGRGEWAEALAAAHPDAIAGAAGPLTSAEEYDRDIVAALASARPDVAFANVADAWPRLTPEQKDDLIDLLEQHGTATSLDALCAIIRDDHRDNAKRRGRAARRIGELLAPGEAVPDAVLDLLNSNLHDLRSAAVEAIERVKPRDAQLIGRLHDVVAGRGAAGKAATNALEALASQFLSEFAAAGDDKTALQELMPVLGAVGHPAVLQPLLEYVGSNAVYDDPVLHRAAAAAIRTAADRISTVSADDQEALVQLIDGEEQETDVVARGDLSAALARLQLGEDVAVKVLYDEIKITPQIEPDRLFGAEKEPLVRQLALLDRSRKRGQDGWGAELAHLDNVAERLVRSAYLASDGTSPAICDQIRNDSRTPDYGNLIGALTSTKQLTGVQAHCKVLHDARCTYSEIPHAGQQADAATMTSARQSFVKLAKTCVGTLVASKK
jgi:hypothetical protein